MKKNKFMAILTIAAVLMCMLTGCDSSTAGSWGGGGAVNNNSEDEGSNADDNATLTGTVTLKQFLDSGPKVGFVIIPDKPKYPLIYFFEDGKVYMVCTHSSSDGPRANDSIFKSGSSSDGEIPWSEFDRKTDDEMVEYARSHKQLRFVWYGRNTWKKVDEFSTGEYRLHIYTDYTGVSRAYERIEVHYEDGDHYSSGYSSLPDMGGIKLTADKVVINGSTYSGFADQDGNKLYFRTGNDLTIVLDNIGDEGVEVD